MFDKNIGTLTKLLEKAIHCSGNIQTHVVDGGHGRFGLQGDLTQVFGLSDQCEAIVTVVWPDANATTETHSVQANQTLEITQGGEAVPVMPSE